jgi:mannose-6-phosphate isomerase
MRQSVDARPGGHLRRRCWLEPGGRIARQARLRDRCRFEICCDSWSTMTIELARTQTRAKPWGVTDLRPWSNAPLDSGPTGEIWYERSGRGSPDPALLVKLLFTSQPLSIQVHPDDAFAQSMGLPHGKTEAWYILGAAPEAKVALGLTRQLAPQQLRAVIDDGSIADLVRWQAVQAGDVILVPAGTIHAIGAGLVIAEIQQRSDTTFRLFDFGRRRELHIESAIAVADAGPAGLPAAPRRLTDARTLLVSGPHFALERMDLAPMSNWLLNAERETWLLVLTGDVLAGSIELSYGNALFAEAEHFDIQAGLSGATALVAYSGAGPIADLLCNLDEPAAIDAARQTDAPLFPLRERAHSPLERVET